MTMERLEKEVTRLQERNEMNVVEVRKAMHDVLRIAEVGCSDGGCGVLGRRSGQHTNGGCSCARKIGRRLEGVWRRLKREGIQPNAPHQARRDSGVALNAVVGTLDRKDGGR